MTQNPSFAGIDVGKDRLDVAVFPDGVRWDVPNSPAGHRDLITRLAARGVTTGGVEASGGYERSARDALFAAGISVHVLDPARVRYFAKAKGQRAKTDAIDAAVIAEFTAQLRDTPAQRPDRDREALADLVRMRRLLVDKRADMEKAMARLPDAAKALIRPAIDALRTAVEELEAEIARHVGSHQAVAHTVQVLQSAPGIGPITAVAVAALLPELGRVSGRQAAALLGVAPYPDDSGQRHGQRRIAGGRADARRAVYMAALKAATQTTGILAAFYAHLIARGKPHKVALTACMRELIVRLNAMLASHQTWREQPT